MYTFNITCEHRKAMADETNHIVAAVQLATHWHAVSPQKLVVQR